MSMEGKSGQAALTAIEHILCSEGTEPAQNYAVFKTNQCSDDHLFGMLKITTMKLPKVHRGGHVTVDTMTTNGPLRIRCFKEGGQLNEAIEPLILVLSDRTLAFMYVCGRLGLNQ